MLAEIGETLLDLVDSHVHPKPDVERKWMNVLRTWHTTYACFRFKF
jgi:hypothetical protein